MAHILIAGCGYVGTALGLRLLQDGHVVFGLRRNVDKLPLGFTRIEADLELPRTLDRIPAVDVAVFAAAPNRSDPESYTSLYLRGFNHLLQALKRARNPPRRVLMVSSTSVYGQLTGEWVDETSPTEPVHSNGQLLRKSEEQLAQSKLPYVIFRAAGIYGPGRTKLLRDVCQGLARFPSNVVQFTNRIHRDDCAGALRHLIGLRATDTHYIGADSDPVDRKTLLVWLAEQLGAPFPTAGKVDTSAKRFTSKRCCNDRLLETGYALRYPSFRDGYRPILLNMPAA
ncbi:MAG: SDR family oxidoreductase [Myxococcales bacterium]|nr:SDR family oxidoreductase [Myxococcales bacterium]MCB9709253.1 SDR family oxidoreductase [Myxococcales bacterium]